MADNKTINDYLLDIMTAVYGADMREAIYKSIQECYANVTASETLADAAASNANDAADAANSAAEAANASKAAADTATNNANTARTNANNAASAAATATTNANNAKTAAETAASSANDAASSANSAAAAANSASSYFCAQYGDTTAQTAFTAGDYCIHNNTLYKCLSSVAQGESWTASKWQQTTIGAELRAVIPAAYTTADIEETDALKFLHFVDSVGKYVISGALSVEGLVVDGQDFYTKEQVGMLTVDDQAYLLRTGTSGLAGYITFVLEE